MINCKRAQFSLPKNSVYLNCAYMSPLLKEAEKAGIRALRRKRDPASIRPDDFFEEAEELRRSFAKLVHVQEANRVVIIPSTAYALANVANNVELNRGDNIVLVSEEFPSNYYPWAALAARNGAAIVSVAPPDGTTARGKVWNERLLEAINSQTRIVALGHVHWADGTLFDLAAIRRRTREVNAVLVVDGTQSIGAMPLSVEVLQPDVLVCAAYKWMLGPYSIGMAYYGPRFDHGRPIEEHWMNREGSENFSQLVNYEDRYRSGALRYEVGEHSNFIHVAMLRKSVTQLLRWGTENISEYCASLTREPVRELRDIGYWAEDENYRAPHLFGVRGEERLMDSIRKSLADHRVTASIRGNAVRVSPNIYNTPQDMARLVKAMKHAQRQK